MPLLKLWNAIWGRTVGDQPKQTDGSQSAGSPSAGTLSHERRPGHASPTPRGQVSTPPAASASARKVARSAFGLFAGQPHASLCKLVAKTGARSVLEISVGDGSRAVAVVSTLAKQGEPIRYYGIDQFELVGGAVTLKDFHRTMRSAGIRPQILPEPVDRGLTRFLHTVGSVDLVLLSDPEGLADDGRVRQLLGRVSHSETTILQRHGDNWEKLPGLVTSPVRRAA